MSGRISLADDYLVADFPYHAEQVAQIKAIPGARWDKIARLWKVPVASLNLLRAFAAEHGFDVDNDVLTFDLPDVHDNGLDAGLSLVDDVLYLNFTYDPVKVRMVKRIPGVTWDAKTKAWKAPLTSLPQALEWAEKFRLDVDSGLTEMAASEKSRMDVMVAASQGVEADFDVPTLVGEPFPYQRAGMAYAVSALEQAQFRKGVIIGDQPGLGKTVQSLGVLEACSAFPAVVVCPATLKLNWKAEIGRWLPHRTVQVAVGKRPAEITADVVVVNYDILSGWVDSFAGFKGIVFDESHYIKSKDAARTKAALKLSKKIVSPDAVRLCLTGTPITNRPAELATQLDAVGRLTEFGGYMGYYRTFCAAFRDKWGHWQISGASNLNVLNERMRSVCYVRRQKDQVLPELPAVLHNPVTVEIGGAAAKEYAKAEADIVAYLVERAEQIALELGQSPRSAAVRARMAAEANQHLVKISVLRRLAAKAKMAAIVEWVDSRVDAGNKVVLAAHHRDVVGELADRFGGLKIQGQQTVESIEDHKRRFQTLPVTEAPVIVLSIQAAKTGHTLTAAQDILFCELPWTPADVDQTYGRLHRIGQRGSVTATYMLAADTVDEMIYETIRAKRAVVDAATDGVDPDDVAVGEIVQAFLAKGLG